MAGRTSGLKYHIFIVLAGVCWGLTGLCNRFATALGYSQEQILFARCIVPCVVLGVYLLMILRMLYLARYTRDRFGMLVITGVAGMFLFHVVQNIGMTTGLLPITGIPLPFLSYGGSNMITNMAGVGLVLNVTRNRSLAGSFETPAQSVSLMRYTNNYR